MRDTIYDDAHEAFRGSAGGSLDRESTPHWEAYIESKQFPREMWRALGPRGLLGLVSSERHVGSEADDQGL